MTKRYIHNLKPYYHYDKQSDIEYYGYSRDSVEETFSLIEDELYLAEHYLLKGETGSCLELLCKLKEKL